MKLAIVGSRNFTDYENFKLAVMKVLQEWNITLHEIVSGRNITLDEIVSGRNITLDEIVSGGAKGADSLAERFSKEFQIKTVIYRPDWNLYGKRAGILRNSDIVEHSTHMIAFPSRNGKGTQDSIRKAREKQIPVKVLYID